MNPLEALDESAITHRLSADAGDNAPGEAKAKATKGGNNVEELTPLFSDNQLNKEQKTNKVTLIEKESGLNKAVEMKADFTESKNILTKIRRHRSWSRSRSRRCEPLKKCIPLKTTHAKEEKVAVQK